MLRKMHVGVFVVLYILFMVPTYVLPYLGSNSVATYSGVGVWSESELIRDLARPSLYEGNERLAVLGYVARQMKSDPLYAFKLHLGALLALLTLALSVSLVSGKYRLVMLSFLALMFDLVPFLNWIPGVPTILHVLVICMGVSYGLSARAPRPLDQPASAAG